MVRALAILLLLVSPLFAGWPDNRIVRLSDGGSGAFIQIGNLVAILSCAHRTVDSSVEVGYRIKYECGDDSIGMATVVAVYPLDFNSTPFRDCAIYEMDRQPPVGVEPFTLTTRPTPPNTKVWVVGFPAPNCQFRSRQTVTRGYNGKLYLEGVATSGESGGPIVNEQGEIVGTLTGVEDSRITYACPAVAIGQLCYEVETTWCQNGRCGSCPQQTQIWYPPSQPSPAPKPPASAPPQVPIQKPPQPQVTVEQYNEQNTKIENLIKICNQLTTEVGNAKPCECEPKWETINQQIAVLQADVKASAESTVKLIQVGKDQQAAINELNKKLDHDTPVRVYLPDGTLAGETKVNIFRGDSIDFTFNPRALLDKAAGEQ